LIQQQTTAVLRDQHGNPRALALAAGKTVYQTMRELVAIGRYPWHGALGRFGVADREKVDEAITLVGLKRWRIVW
ncbi:iron-hydroxamate transporter ATP-binding subunit, partial [Salmonella enterica subsp. enterica serovar Heidelberg str. CFSAN002072]